MQHQMFILFLLIASVCAVKHQNDAYSPFFDPIFLEDSSGSDNTTRPQLELLKRQNNNCPSGYGSCNYAGSPSFCCRSNSQCQQDTAGHLACCPVGALCTGTITGTVTGTVTGTARSTTSFVSATSTTSGFIQGSTTAAGGIVVVNGAGSSGTVTSIATISRSYVPNPYFPFAYIPTTYTNAAACSSAYSSCQTDAASCTSFLAGSSGHGVTVNAPNGGTTVTGPLTMFAPGVASSLCSSLSLSACSGLVVAACGNFGTGPATAAAGRCTGGLRYGAGVGMAVGLAGQVMGYK